MKDLKSIITMVLFIFTMAVIISVPFGLAAQDEAPDGRRGNGNDDNRRPPRIPDSTQIVEMVDDLSAELSLTLDQKEAVLDLHFSHFAEAEQLMSQQNGDREQHREKMEALRDEFLEDMKELLTDTQFEKYEEHINTRDPRSGAPKRHGR